MARGVLVRAGGQNDPLLHRRRQPVGHLFQHDDAERKGNYGSRQGGNHEWGYHEWRCSQDGSGSRGQ